MGLMDNLLLKLLEIFHFKYLKVISQPVSLTVLGPALQRGSQTPFMLLSWRHTAWLLATVRAGV